jgi:hypothetical protein
MDHTLHRQVRKAYVIDATDPRGMGVCDGCGFWQNHKDLRKHMAYRGGSVPVWDGFLVCDSCYDVPNPAPQFKRLVLPPDPVPLEMPRPEVPMPTLSGYAYWVTESGDYVNTLDSTLTWGGDYVQTTPNAS